MISGLVDACKANGCALLGGETAELPSSVRAKSTTSPASSPAWSAARACLPARPSRTGDFLLGLPSNGLHTNGYSLAQELLFDAPRYTPRQYVNELERQGRRSAHAAASQLSLAHPQADPGGGRQRLRAHHRRRHHGEPAARSAQRPCAHIELSSWEPPPLFAHLQQLGTVDPRRDAAHLQHGRGPGGHRARRSAQEGAC